MEPVEKNDERHGWQSQTQQANAEDDEGWGHGYGSILLRYVIRFKSRFSEGIFPSHRRGCLQ